MGTLYIVATPIGNLEDITFRAVRLLSEVDLIAAEDTRKTKILLDRYNINKPLTSYHKFNIRTKTSHIIGLLNEGKNIALVSDAGSPGISDPGFELIRESVNQGINVVPIPGPSAVITALSVSGLNTDKFIFLGFLPRKPGKQRKIFTGLINFDGTIIIYESPFRAVKTLKEILNIFGDRNVVVARELTKKFEEVVRGKISHVLGHFTAKDVRGEVTVLIEGKRSKQAAQSGEI
ncbi:16S rRNA (cytidine(1402)-2'-O)-methyltransferase [Candidatus Saganbacteria bacterium]|nr:16S rRNA (cytidine(1402)-2'-O)-methyltransferase [Candidatus Saganbacteria bacterium]